MADNISELPQPNEREIPGNWDLPENFKEHHRILQINYESRFISYEPTTPSEHMRYHTEKTGEEGEKTPIRNHRVRMEKFFNAEGKESARMRRDFHDEPRSKLDLISGLTWLRFNGEIENGYSFFSLPGSMHVTFVDDTSKAELGLVAYSGNNLDRVVFNGNFLSDSMDKYSTEKDPEVWLYAKKDNSGFVGQMMQSDWRIESGESQNEIDCYSKTGERVHISWGIDDDRYIVEYKDLNSGKTNTISAPITVNVQEVESLTQKEPPYQTAKHYGSEVLDVPWVKVPEAVGVNLSPSIGRKQN